MTENADSAPESATRGRRRFLARTIQAAIGLVSWLFGRRAQAAGYYNVGAFFKTQATVATGPMLFAWGPNGYGQLGTGDIHNRSSPVAFGAGTAWSQVCAGGFPAAGTITAIRSDGTLWTTGYNGRGGLGLGDTVYRSSPTQVGSLSTWIAICSDSWSTLGIQAPGSLWAWGSNNYGTLGTGNTLFHSSPVQVGALTTWSKLAMGGWVTLATRTDGTLWGWGFCSVGQLANNNAATYKSSPVQIGSLSVWAAISACGTCYALSTAGTLWAWGQGAGGMIGNGSTITYSSLVQIGTLTTWTNLTRQMAIRSNGTLWGWGANAYGQLGTGNHTSYSSPVQIGALTTWAQVVFSGTTTYTPQGFGLGIQTNGTLWGWGMNGYVGDIGCLGTGNTVNYSSPVQVGSVTTWISVSVGYQQVVAALRN